MSEMFPEKPGPRCMSFTRSGGILHYCDLPDGHNGSHINVKTNGVITWGTNPPAAPKDADLAGGEKP